MPGAGHGGGTVTLRYGNQEGLFEKGAFKQRQEFKMSQPFESEGTNIPDWKKTREKPESRRSLG